MVFAWHGSSLLTLFLVHFLRAEASEKNPFIDQAFYINPVNSKEFDASISTSSGRVAQNLKKMQKTPSAYWIDTKDKIRGEDTRNVEGILKDASSKTPPELVVLMWYDLPNRDCDAKASNGEICCSSNADGTCDYLATGDCASGLHTYKSEYVDPFVDVLSEYDGKLQVVLVMEPDGLANLATNIADPHCGNIATQTAYKEGVRYAVEQITSKAPSVSIYLDAAHGGWLGWENNLGKFMKMLQGLELPFSKIRGFATNVANYQALGVQCPWCPDQGFRNGFCLNNKHSSDPCCKDPTCAVWLCSFVTEGSFVLCRAKPNQSQRWSASFTRCGQGCWQFVDVCASSLWAAVRQLSTTISVGFGRRVVVLEPGFLEACCQRTTV